MENTKFGIKTELEDIGPVQKKLKVEIPVEDVSREFDSAYRDLRSEAALSGFRKGKVPMNVLKAKFGDRILGDVASRLIEKTYPDAITEKGLSPVARPEIEVESIEEGKSFSYSATVEVKPSIDVDGYIGVELDRKEVEVTDKEVEQGLDRLRESRAEYREVERGAEDGDLVMIDFVTTMDGSPVKGGTAADYPVVLGGGELLPGVKEGLKGTSKGDKKDINTKLPEAHKEKTLAGKDVVFNVIVKAVKEKVTPELDDEFAKDLECENLDGLRAKVSEEIKKGKEAGEKERLKGEILKTLIEKNPFEVPESLVNSYLAPILNSVLGNIQRGAFHPDDKDMTPEQLKSKYREIALRQVKGDLILESIAEKEKIEAKDTEIEAFIEGMAKTRKTTPSALRAELEKQGNLHAVESEVKAEKVFALLFDKSKEKSRIIMP